MQGIQCGPVTLYGGPEGVDEDGRRADHDHQWRASGTKLMTGPLVRQKTETARALGRGPAG